MSTIKVHVTKIDEIRPHPNADKLEIAIVGGWQACVRKDAHKAGKEVVYFEPGTVLPETVADTLMIKPYLSNKTDVDGNKVLVVHRVKLRGESSFGLVIHPPLGVALGDDVADRYGANKYIPPIKNTCGDAMENHYLFPQYTDIENMRNYPTIFKDGEEVVATEKAHGTSQRSGFVAEDGQMVLMAGSKTMRRKPPEPEATTRSTYWYPMSLHSVKEFLADMYDQGHQQVIIFGEVYGSGVQDFNYGLNGLGFAAFDIMVDGKYVDCIRFSGLCAQYKIPHVPPLYRGPFSLQTIEGLSCGPSQIGGSHGREGVVVKPVIERDDPGIGRVILKYVGDDYLFRRGNEQDTTDA